MSDGDNGQENDALGSLSRPLVRERRATLAAMLREVRLHRGLTQEAVALRSGIGTETYRMLETGMTRAGTQANPRLGTLMSVLDCLHIEVELRELPSDNNSLSGGR